ncbi:hypothetical protein CSC18_3877 [Klebsiella aerogenes]|nr:hypothetical protein CSC18_3877 [Klebsiella aerogenes]
MRLKIKELSFCAVKIKAPRNCAALHKNEIYLLVKLSE